MRSSAKNPFGYCSYHLNGRSLTGICIGEKGDPDWILKNEDRIFKNVRFYEDALELIENPTGSKASFMAASTELNAAGQISPVEATAPMDMSL